MFQGGYIFEDFIIDLILDSKIASPSSTNILNLENITGLLVSSGVLIINNLVILGRPNIATIAKINGFLLGALLSSVFTTMLIYKESHRNSDITFNKKFNIKNPAVLKNLLKSIYFMFLSSNPVSKLVRKIGLAVTKLLIRLPSFKNYFMSVAVDSKSDIIISGKSFLFYGFLGLVVGGFLGYLFLKNYLKIRVTLSDVVDIFSNNIKSNYPEAIYTALRSIQNRNPQGQLLLKLNPTNNKFVKTYETISKDITRKFNSIKEAESYFGSEYNVLLDVKKIDSDRYIEQMMPKLLVRIDKVTVMKIIQAFRIVKKEDPNFKKYVKYVMLSGNSNYDNAYSTNIFGLGGVIAFVYKFDKTSYRKETVEENIATIYHELGHLVTGIFQIYPTVAVTEILLSLILFDSNSFVRMLINYSIYYSFQVTGRISEMQADAYAVKRGYGDALYSGLKKYAKKIKDETYQDLDVHDKISIRLDAIKQATKKLKELEKQKKGLI